MTATGDAADAGARVQDSKTVEHGVRLGFVAYGLVHLVVAFLAIRLALGDREGSASSSGALKELAQQPFGAVLLWLVVAGMAVLVLWRLLEFALGRQDEGDDPEWGKRASSLFKAVIYGVLGFSAAKTVAGAGGGGSKGEETMTSTVLGWPGGQWLVVLGGLAIVGYGVFLVRQGFDEKHAKHLEGEGRSGQSGRAYLLLGKVGYAAKGVALVVVGGLVVWAGATHDAKKSGGLDEALALVLSQPFGPVLVALIGGGLACYGLFCFARARHLSR